MDDKVGVKDLLSPTKIIDSDTSPTQTIIVDKSLSGKKSMVFINMSTVDQYHDSHTIESANNLINLKLKNYDNHNTLESQYIYNSEYPLQYIEEECQQQSFEGCNSNEQFLSDE